MSRRRSGRQGAASGAWSGQSAQFPTSRRRCRTAPAHLCGDRPAGRSRRRRAAPRSRGRRFPDQGRSRVLTRARNSAPLAAARQASVAISRACVTGRLSQLVGADFQRLDGAVHGAPAAGGRWRSAPRPAARCARRHRRRGTVRAWSGVAISRRQLLVPRSSAA